MATTCDFSGWGSTPWGVGGWGSSLDAEPGGPLPYASPFDLFCVGPCGPVSLLPTYDGVEVTAESGQLTADPATLDLVVLSGGPEEDTTAKIVVDVPVDVAWTLEATVRFDDLPADFAAPGTSHVFLGAADQQGFCAGLLFSLQGVVYLGSGRYGVDGRFLQNGATQLLPGTIGLVEEGIFYTIRIAVDGRGTSPTAFVYITETSAIPSTGHVLRAVLPAIPSSACIEPPVDGATLSLAGASDAPVQMVVNSLCLGNGIVVPNLPPVADAGRDQAARICSIVRLDGRASFDPEGAPLTYRWRLVDAPDVSAYVVVGAEGSSPAAPPVLVNRFYAPELADADVVVGDVLLIRGEPHTIVTTGTDGLGFYIAVDGYVLQPSMANELYKLIRQRGVSGPGDTRPTFYPDVVGVFRFDLTVFDGGLHSEPAAMIVNVVESATARGVVPDMTFLWSYLSDVWKIVEDTDVLPVFWSALAQVISSELLALWQIDYGKSLKDIQRTFQRRWLHYDMYLQEPLPEDTAVLGLSSGVYSIELPLVPDLALPGATIDVASPLFGNAQVQLQGATFSVEEAADQIRRQLGQVHPGFAVDYLQNLEESRAYVRVRAPFHFTLLDSSTAPLFDYPASPGPLFGSGGGSVGSGIYRLDRPLTDISLDDLYLLLDGEAYRALRTLSDPSDPYLNQRVSVEGALPLAASADWALVRAATSSFVDFHKALCSDGDVAVYEMLDQATGALIYANERVLGAAEGGKLLTTQDVIGPVLGADGFAVHLYGVHRRTYVPIDPIVADVPTLQEKIQNEDDREVLRENVDYYLEEFRGAPCLRFVTSDSGDDVWQHGLPPTRMWAEVTHLDNRPTIEANFGIPAEFALDDLAKLPANVDYLSVVRGLWYAYFNGPTVRNLRVGTQILLGLPFAEEAGTIVEIRKDFSPSQGRILVRDEAAEEVVRSYTYPRPLELEVNPATGARYQVGDKVEHFAPLVEGVEVVDYLKDPKWFQGYLQQGSFYEVEKFFRFLVRIDSEAFSLPALLYAQTFVKRIKPTYTYPLFVVLKSIGGLETEINTTDDVAYYGRLTLNDQVCEERVTFSYDDARAAGGGYVNQFDSGAPLLPPPTYPTAGKPVLWGYDRNLLCPEDLIVADAIMVLPAPHLPTYDSIYAWDSVLHKAEPLGVFGIPDLVAIPSGGISLGSVTSAVDFNITNVSYHYAADAVTPVALDLVIDVFVVGVLQSSSPFTVPAGTISVGGNIATTIATTTGDGVEVQIRPAVPATIETGFSTSIIVTLGVTYAWAIDVATPAGTYHAYKTL